MEPRTFSVVEKYHKASPEWRQLFPGNLVRIHAFFYNPIHNIKNYDGILTRICVNGETVNGMEKDEWIHDKNVKQVMEDLRNQVEAFPEIITESYLYSIGFRRA